MAAENATSSLSLKYLDFVPKYASQASDIVGSTYKTARSYTPSFVEQYVSRTEQSVSGISAPWVTYVQDNSAKILRSLDEKVDGSKLTLSQNVEHVKGVHEKGLKAFEEARSKYYTSVEKLADYVTENLSPSALTNTASETLRAAVNKAKELSDPDVAFETVRDAWNKFAAVPVISNVLGLANPVVKVAEQQGKALHDFVVANPAYKWVYDTTTGTASKVPETFVYKKVKDVVYPYVAGYADPAYEKVVKSKYLNQLAQYVQPVA